ncbi:MAG: HAD-IA family hydrolase [Patescibacteria group bacterium]|nr:HAD-IA family hydrolase [Patescibacteria group bacterium]
MSIDKQLERVSAGQKTNVIFDFDETLCTLHIDWGGWSNRMAEAIRRYDPEFRGYPSAEELNGLVHRYGQNFRQDMIEANALAEREFFSGYSRNDNALEFLRRVSNYAQVHLWTSNDRRTVEPILQELDIAGLFRHTVFNNDVTFMKPDPDGMRYINSEGLPVTEFLFYGDSAYDRGACEAAGIEFVHIGLL